MRTTFFIYAFTSIFIIVNPLGGIITFISLSQGMTDAEKLHTVKRSVLISCILALFFAFITRSRWFEEAG